MRDVMVKVRGRRGVYTLPQVPAQAEVKPAPQQVSTLTPERLMEKIARSRAAGHPESVAKLEAKFAKMFGAVDSAQCRALGSALQTQKSPGGETEA